MDEKSPAKCSSKTSYLLQFFCYCNRICSLFFFINISFLNVLTRNRVCWWNNNFEKLALIQHHESFTMLKSRVNVHLQCTRWKFHYVKVFGEFLLTVHWCKSSSLKVLQIFTHDIREESIFSNTWRRLKDRRPSMTGSLTQFSFTWSYIKGS